MMAIAMATMIPSMVIAESLWCMWMWFAMVHMLMECASNAACQAALTALKNEVPNDEIKDSSCTKTDKYDDKHLHWDVDDIECPTDQDGVCKLITLDANSTIACRGPSGNNRMYATELV